MKSLIGLLSDRKAGPSAYQGFHTRRAATAGLIVFGVALIGMIAIGTAVMIDRFRQNAIEAGKEQLEKSVLLLARHFDRQFEDFEVLQRGIAADLESQGIDSPDVFSSDMGTLAIHEALRAKASGWADIAGANVWDYRGFLINSSQQWPVPDLQIADRAYFRRMKADPQLRVGIEERIDLAHYGSLTDLPNRILFRQYVERKLSELSPDGSSPSSTSTWTSSSRSMTLLDITLATNFSSRLPRV